MQIDMVGSEEWIKAYPPERLQQYDVLYLLEYAHAGLGRQIVNKIKPDRRPLLVISHNSDRHRRNEMWDRVVGSADYVIANNRCVWEWAGRLKRTCNISNGVDENDFYVTTEIQDREHRIIWCGSTSAKKGKGYQDILLPAVDELQELGFICDFRPIDDINERVVYPTERQRNWYNSASYVVCASSTEGTPNFLLEGMACGCVGVSTRVGNAPEFGVDNENMIFFERDSESFIEAMKNAKSDRERLSKEAVNVMRGWTYGESGNRAEYFFQLFRRLIIDGPDSVKPFCHLEVKPEQI